MLPGSTDSPEKLRLLPVQVVEITDGVILKRGALELKITGERAVKAVHLVLRHLAVHTLSRDDLCGRFTAPDRPLVSQLIDLLRTRHLLVPASQVVSPGDLSEPGQDVFYWHFGSSEAHARRQLHDARITILGVNCISRQIATMFCSSGFENFEVVDYPLLRNLRMFGKEEEIEQERWGIRAKSPLPYRDWVEKTAVGALDCLIATSDFGHHPVFRDWNRFCVTQARMFLPVMLKNMIGQVGPLVVPGESACFECFRARRNSHLPDPTTTGEIENSSQQGQHVTAFHPSMASILGDFAAFEMVKLFGPGLPRPQLGTVIEINLLATRLTTHKILKIPRCPVCSPLLTRSAQTPYKTEFTPASRPIK